MTCVSILQLIQDIYYSLKPIYGFAYHNYFPIRKKTIIPISDISNVGIITDIQYGTITDVQYNIGMSKQFSKGFN